jgi:integrase
MKKSPNGEGSVYYENNTGRYVFAFTDLDGKRRRRRFKTRKEADKARRETLTSMDRGEYVEASAMTVGQWLDIWLKEYAALTERKSTLSVHKIIITTHLVPTFNSIHIQGLRPEHIQAFINKQVARGYAPTTIKRQIATLTGALNQAVKNNIIVRNPINAAKLPKLEQKEIEFLTDNEVHLLLRVLPNNTHGRAIRFILGTGLRVSELCGLRWCDLSPNEISVRQITYTENGEHVIEAPKTKAGRRNIPLNGRLREILEEQRQAQQIEYVKAGAAWQGSEAGKGEQYIFASSSGTPSDRNHISRTLRSVLKKAGLKSRGVHALRHTFATNAIHSGIDPSTLAGILGHSNGGFTMKIYVHNDKTASRKAMETMSKII